MNTIKNHVKAEQIINKSRFICNLYPINSVDEACKILSQNKKTHYSANHNCYSYILGEDIITAKSSDDGEPSRTAGIVIFEVLKKQDLSNILAVVTRYFGGIKLGKGGLIRAYGSSVSLALENAEIIKIEKYLNLTFHIQYQDLNLIEKIITASNYQEISRSFQNDIQISLLIPENDLLSLKEKLIQITNGKIIIKV